MRNTGYKPAAFRISTLSSRDKHQAQPRCTASCRRVLDVTDAFDSFDLLAVVAQSAASRYPGYPGQPVRFELLGSGIAVMFRVARLRMQRTGP